MVLVHRGPVEAVGGEAARAGVLDEEIGPGQEAIQDVPAGSGPEIQGQAAFPGVERQEQGRLVADSARPLHPVRVTGQRLDLDDLGAEGGEEAGGVGAGHEPGEIDDPLAGERAAYHGLGSRNSPNAARNTSAISPTVAPARAAVDESGHDVDAVGRRRPETTECLAPAIGRAGRHPGRGAGDLTGGHARIGLEQGQVVGVRARVVDVDIDADLGPAAGDDVLFTLVRRFGDPRLRDALFEGGHGAPQVVYLGQHGPGPGLELVGQMFDHVGAGQWVGVAGHARFEGDDLLGPQGQARRPLHSGSRTPRRSP